MDARKRKIDKAFRAQTEASRAQARLNTVDSSDLHKGTKTIKSGYNMHGVSANSTSPHSVRGNKSSKSDPSSGRVVAGAAAGAVVHHAASQIKGAWGDVKDSSVKAADVAGSSVEQEKKRMQGKAATGTVIARSQIKIHKEKQALKKGAANAARDVKVTDAQTLTKKRYQVKARSSELNVRAGLMDKQAMQKKHYLRSTFRGARIAALSVGAVAGAANRLGEAAAGERDITENVRARSLSRSLVHLHTRKRLKAIKRKGAAKSAKTASSALKAKGAMNASKRSQQIKHSLGSIQKAALKIKEAAAKAATRFARAFGSALKGLMGALKVALGAIAPYALGIVSVLLAVLLLLGVVFGAAGAKRPADTGLLTGNEKIIVDFYLSHGLTPEATAAIMGNMYQESGFNAGSIQDGNIAKGILQWERPRFDDLERFATSRGKPWWDLESQLEFSLIEIRSMISAYSGIARKNYPNGEWSGWDARHYTFEEWNQIKNVALQTEIFERTYTRASIPNMPRRIAKAQEIYELLTLRGRAVASTADRQKIINRAMSALGTRYVWGGASRDGFDCSGLVSYAIRGKYEHTWTTFDIMKWQRTDRPQIGDLIVNDHHVGIVLGDGMMIHAPQTGEVVKVSPYGWMLAEGGTIFVTPQGFIP